MLRRLSNHPGHVAGTGMIEFFRRLVEWQCNRGMFGDGCSSHAGVFALTRIEDPLPHCAKPVV